MATKSAGNGKSLVIVESPAKAKTINRYLGPNYIVKASMGHVRDMPKGGLNVDVRDNFKPTYEIIDTRRKLVNELKAAAKGAAQVFLATDLDREGEAIAWHLAQALGLDENTALRVVFNEITKSAILNAFKNPNTIDIDKVNAQQARRILDRLVGYQVSPILWKKVASGLSAGRVQSVAVKLVVDREKEIRAFMPEEYWKLSGVFTTDLLQADDLRAQWRSFLAGDEEEEADDGTDSAAAALNLPPTQAEKTAWMGENHAFRADLIEWGGKKFDPKDVPTARAAAEAAGLVDVQIQTTTNDGTNGPRGIPAKGPALNLVKVVGVVGANTGVNFTVRDLITKQSTSRPPGPFSTSTLQQAASNALGFGAQRTMRVAQQLYEGVDLGGEIGAVGLITYMRTDSQNISREALDMVRTFITESFGPRYLPASPNVFAAREGAQEAHEAIRPTDVLLAPAQIRGALSEEQFRLYDLIWKRFVACQMTPAQWLVTEVLIDARRAAQTAAVATFKATGRSLQFDGFMKVSGIFSRFDEQLLPQLARQQAVAPIDLTPTQHFTAPPPRFSEASLVKALESEGIGRPSTYANIIATIQDRGYVESRGRALWATDLGIVVTEKLVEGFPDIMDYGFTRKIEGELDQIEESQRNWVEVIGDFYTPLRKDLDHAEERMTHARAESQPSEYKCPQCQAPMAYRLSKRGKKFLSCTRYPDCKGATNVDRDGKPQQLELTEFMCPACGKPMIKRVGRFGPFFGCSGYPTCKTIQPADRKSGLPLPPKPPAEDTGLPCPKCHKKNILKRTGKRGDFLSCGGYPRCRLTLSIDRLEEFKTLLAQGQWPPPDVTAKISGTKVPAEASTEAPADAAAVAAPKPKRKAPAKTRRAKPGTAEEAPAP